ncbi:MAG TPA: hypothetical protein DCE08_04325 [Ruminococcaceae bacterium]|nr:hypothetical protein [Oscillospiraceae bacterium]
MLFCTFGDFPVLLIQEIFAAVSFFAPQSDSDRLPSFQEGSCRRRRLRGVGVRKEVNLQQSSPSPIASERRTQKTEFFDENGSYLAAF